MGYKPGVRKCAHSKCNVRFKKSCREQIYHSKKCRDAAAQERLRDRAKRFNELNAEVNGVGAGI